MKIFNQSVTFQSCLNLAGIDPRLNNITKLSLAAVGAGSFVASRFFTARKTGLFAAASAGVAWLGLRIYSRYLPPKYPILKDLESANPKIVNEALQNIVARR